MFTGHPCHFDLDHFGLEEARLARDLHEPSIFGYNVRGILVPAGWSAFARILSSSPHIQML